MADEPTPSDDALVERWMIHAANLLDDALREPCSHEMAGRILVALVPIIHVEKRAAYIAGQVAMRDRAIAIWPGDALPALEPQELGE